MEGMLNAFRTSGGPQAKYLWMLEAFADEGVEELQDAIANNPGSEAVVVHWFTELSALFGWIATGQIPGDLPDWLTKQPKELDAPERAST
jgi:hypothetical protein